MTILGICFDSTSQGVMHHHDAGLVVLSFVIALVASFCSLDMAERMRASEGRTRLFWLILAGITLGGGIWSMHFIAMTAFHVPIEQGYDAGLTLLSGVIAVLAVIAGLAALGRKPSWARLVGAGVFVGMGVVVNSKSAPQCRHIGFNPERRRAHPPPAGQNLGSPIQHRIDPLVGRIARQADCTSGIRLTQVPGEKACPFHRQTRIVGLKPGCQRLLVSIAAKDRRRGQITQPLLKATRSLLRRSIGQPESIQCDEASDPGRTNPSVNTGNISTQAVTHQIHRLLRRAKVQDRIQIAKIIGKPVGIAAPFRPAKAAPVGRNDMPVRRQRVHDELKGRGHIHPAVKHEDPGRSRLAPLTKVIAQATDRQETASGRRHPFKCNRPLLGSARDGKVRAVVWESVRLFFANRRRRNPRNRSGKRTADESTIWRVMPPAHRALAASTEGARSHKHHRCNLSGTKDRWGRGDIHVASAPLLLYT